MQPVPRPSRRVLADGVYDALLSMLMDHVIEPGTRISIDGLARDLQVSPTPVREALARLEAEGLVAKRSLEGYTAAPLLDARGFAELFEMRLLLEPAAAFRAAARITTEVLSELDRLVAEARAFVNSAEAGRDRFVDYREFAANDTHFHALITEAAGNRLLADAVLRLRTHRHTFRLYFTQGIAASTPDEHQAIVQALAARDGEAAADAIRAHIEASRDRLSSAFSAV